MDLSWVKWPIIGIAVIAIMFLFSGTGISWMAGNFSDDPVGEDPKVDRMNEAGLTRIGWFLMRTFRYERARRVLETAVNLYPNGENALLNYYRLAKCYEKAREHEQAVEVLDRLQQLNAHARDKRVPVNENLKLRADKLRETHQMGTIGSW